MNSTAKIALYDNLDRNEKLALAIDAAIRKTKKDGWRGNKIKEREIKNAIKQQLELFTVDSPEDDNALGTLCERIFEIVKNQSEY